MIKLHNNPIIISDTEPTGVDMVGPWLSTDWRWFNTNECRWYDYEGGQWVLQGDEPVVGLNLSHDGDKMEITKLTIVDGVVTELEFGT